MTLAQIMVGLRITPAQAELAAAIRAHRPNKAGAPSKNLPRGAARLVAWQTTRQRLHAARDAVLRERSAWPTRSP